MKNANAIERCIDAMEAIKTAWAKEQGKAARAELADLQTNLTNLEGIDVACDAAIDHVLKLQAELARYTEIGPCGHPKAFWVQQHSLTFPVGAPPNYETDGYCRVCREIEMIDAAKDAEEHLLEELIWALKMLDINDEQAADAGDTATPEYLGHKEAIRKLTLCHIRSPDSPQQAAERAQCHPAACRDEMLWRSEIEQAVAGMQKKCEQVAGHKASSYEGMSIEQSDRGDDTGAAILHAKSNVLLDCAQSIRSLDSSAAQLGKKRIREEALREAATLICHYCGKGEYPHRVGSDTGNWYHGEMLSPCKAAGMYNQYPTLAMIDKPKGGE